MSNLQSTKSADVDAVVVGAGFSGMYMVHKLRDQLGLTVKGYERADNVGGTWYWNRYPGARCDSESYIYCYSFNKEMLQEWEWSGKYPEQPEILKYLNYAADRLDVRRSFQFNTSVVAARFLDADNLWEIETDRGEKVLARYFITAIGCLSTGQVPKIKGLDSFKGQWYHTGGWPHEGVDFSGKRVGVIGTGSSGVQSIPVIAQQAGHLTVFQRTPQFAVPARHGTVDRAYLEKVKANYDSIWEKARSSYAGYTHDRGTTSALALSDEEREARFEAGWQQGGFQFLSLFSDTSLDRRANDTAAEFIRRKIRQTVNNPETAEKLLPTDHPLGSKRSLIDTDYFETYNRDNVQLVDSGETPIQRITATGLDTTDRSFDFDVIIYSTGFDAFTGAFDKIDIRGAGGVKLKDKWKNGIRAFLGMQSHGFPNFFTLVGPNNGASFCNIPRCIEQNVDWVTDLLRTMRDKGLTRVEATRDAEDAWTAHVIELGQKMLFTKVDSWFMGINSNVEGKQTRTFLLYSGGAPMYREKCDEVAARDYEGIALA